MLDGAKGLRPTLFLLLLFVQHLLGAQPVSTPWYSSAFTTPTTLETKPERPIIIAVVDDGFRLNHTALRDFLYQNPKDKPGNRIDEDGNGLVDDYTGWDISDNDPDVSLPEGRENTFYHGTFICGVITNLLQQSYGAEASHYFKILPVKVLPDQAQNTLVKDGYRGIAYAIAQKADIIVCAWNGGYLSPEEEKILTEASNQGITIIASAGNFVSKDAAPPASHPSVIAISALDSNLQKLPSANYGEYIDLSGPGQNVIGASSMNDQSNYTGEGTSAAVAVVAAGFAQLKALSPLSNPKKLLQALKNTSKPIDQQNLRYAGKLGAGYPDLEKARTYLLAAQKSFNSSIPEGTISAAQMPPKVQSYSWEIKPAGIYKGVWAEAQISEKFGKNTQLSFLDEHGQLVERLPNKSNTSRVFIPGSQAHIVFEQNRKQKVPDFNINYHVESIDSATLYCSNLRYYELEKSRIPDGSEKENYANGCDCKWQISVPPGKRIRLRFLDFDTQAKVDFVYLFDGESTRMDNILAKFSGPAIPPEITSRSNKVLIWFVTDHLQTAKGWTLEYETVEK